jgi:DNA-directed RNA polymerase subunit RPC12/RpoP
MARWTPRYGLTAALCVESAMMIDKAPIGTTQPTCPQCGAPVALPDYADGAVCAYCGSTLERDRSEVLTLGARQGAQQQRLKSVRCSQCAGSLSAHEGKRVLVCDHCGVRVAVLEHGGLTHWYFPARVDRARALAVGAAWLRDYPGIAAEVRDAEPVEAVLAFVPIWEHKVLTAGWEFGSEHRTRVVTGRNPMTGETDEVMELQLLHEGVQEPRLQERRHYLPAADFVALGACRPRVTGRELLVPLLAGELDASALVLEVKGEASEVVEGGRTAAQMPLTGAADPDLHLFLFREGVSLLYYPLWLLRFRHDGTYCRVIVDARTGTVNSGQAPADQSKLVLALVTKIVALAMVVLALAYFGITFAPGRGPLLAGAVLLSVMAVLLRVRFRPQKEVEYHDSFSS